MNMLMEEGQALQAATENLDAVVIGGGQAGLATGYHLARRGMRFAILEAGARVGDSWRQRWDSLRLFTQAIYDGLPGMRFPAPADFFPTKDEMADYLESYAGRFALPVRTGTRVERVRREGDRYRIVAGGRTLTARHVVVAMGSYQKPLTPALAAELDPAIMQLHSAAYRSPRQLGRGDVLLVGAGNSGAEIARDLAGAGRTLYLSGRDVGQVPFSTESWMGRKVASRIVLGLAFNHLLTVRTPPGRRARAAVLARGGILIRVRGSDLARLGVQRVPRLSGTRDGRPLLEDGRTLEVGNVIWCTGFRGGWEEWLQLPVFDGTGHPHHDRGVVPREPGLYFVGLHFQYAMSSGMIQGVGRDARYVVDRIAERESLAAAA